jgi:hypothetical protein
VNKLIKEFGLRKSLLGLLIIFIENIDYWFMFDFHKFLNKIRGWLVNKV